VDDRQSDRPAWCHNWQAILVCPAPGGCATQRQDTPRGITPLSRGGVAVSTRSSAPGLLSFQTRLNTKRRGSITTEKHTAAISPADCPSARGTVPRDG